MCQCMLGIPDSKFHGANLGPTWVLSAPAGPHLGPMNLAIRDIYSYSATHDDVMTRKLFDTEIFYTETFFRVTEPSVRGTHLSPVDTPHKVSVTRSFNVSFGVCLNKQLNKQWSYRWFQTPWHLCHVKIISKMLCNQGWRHRGGKLTIPITYEIYVYGFLRLFR